jgi:ribosomal protein S18 acetylase RimI-like enzyme
MIEIRAADLDDIDEIIDLVHSSYRGDSSRAGWTTEADLLDGSRTDRNEVTSMITDDGSMILVCVDDDVIVGSVNIRRQGSACYLGMLSVSPQVQGSGVGRKLIAAAERRAHAEWGSEKMEMTVFSVRSELVAYYERRGYHRTGEKRPFVGDDVHGTPRVEGLEFDVLEKSLLS